MSIGSKGKIKKKKGQSLSLQTTATTTSACQPQGHEDCTELDLIQKGQNSGCAEIRSLFDGKSLHINEVLDENLQPMMASQG